MEQYAIYLRKSRQDEEAEKLGDGETLARHRKILDELAKRKGLFVGETYEEIVSGENIENRPQIKRLISDCYAGKWKGIIIVESTRLSRGNQADAQTIMDCLKYSNNRDGVLVITPTKTYDIAHSYDDERYMEFELFMSRQEYNLIQRRMDRGRKQAVVEGNYMGSYRPYGYDIVKNKFGRTLTPNPEEAPIVKNIFEWSVNENLSAGKIAERLNLMGVPTYKGGIWNHSTIKTILTNPTYYGKVKWNDRMCVKKMVDGKIVKSRPRSNHTEHFMLHDGKHQALITEELFLAASSKYHSDRTKANLKLQNPLAGLLVCKHCQMVMAFAKYKKAQPRFNHAYRPANPCNVKSVMYKDVINAVCDSLKSHINDFEMKVDNLPDIDENTIQGKINDTEKQIKSIEAKLAKLFDSWEDGIIDNQEFLTRKEHHNATIDRLRKQISELETSIPEVEEYEEKIVSFSEAIELLKDETIDADIKNEFLKKIIRKIEFSRESNDSFDLDVYVKW